MPYENLRKGRYSTSGSYYSITLVTEGRITHFTDLAVARSTILEMKRFQDEAVLSSYAWVLMPEHLHWIFKLGSPLTLSAAVKYLKARSARRINLLLQRRGSLWQKAFYDHGNRSDEDLLAYAQYVIENPVRRGLVSRIEDYPFWDAVWISPHD